MNENYKIYVHIFPNGKLYIGQTRQSLKNRFGKNGYNYKGCKRMSDAICEFGWDNIIHLLLFDNLTSEITDIIEIELIKKYKTYDINYGYNMTLGGEGSLGHKVSEKLKEKNRNRILGKKGKDCPNSFAVIADGKEYESITDFCIKNNLSREMVEKWLKGEVRLPKEWLDKDLRLKDKKDKRLLEPQEKPFNTIIKYDGKIFNSQRELADYLEVSPATVCNWFKGKTKIPKKYLDNCIEFINRENPSNMIVLEGESTAKTKVFYDGVIYSSQAEMSRQTGINKATINTHM